MQLCSSACDWLLHAPFWLLFWLLSEVIIPQKQKRVVNCSNSKILKLHVIWHSCPGFAFEAVWEKILTISNVQPFPNLGRKRFSPRLCKNGKNKTIYIWWKKHKHFRDASDGKAISFASAQLLTELYLPISYTEQTMEQVTDAKRQLKRNRYATARNRGKWLNICAYWTGDGATTIKGQNYANRSKLDCPISDQQSQWTVHTPK